MMFQWTQMGMRLHFNANIHSYKHLCAHTKIYWKVFIAFESFFKDELAFQIVDAHIIWLSLHFAINYFILKRNEKNAFPNGSTVENITAENMPYSFACVFFFLSLCSFTIAVIYDPFKTDDIDKEIARGCVCVLVIKIINILEIRLSHDRFSSCISILCLETNSNQIHSTA